MGQRAGERIAVPRIDYSATPTRSRLMGRIRGKNTKPELRLRQLLRSAGARGYRVRNNLPGRPDIVFRRELVCVFVDGCFWHSCPRCRIRQPARNVEYWSAKLLRNVQRDKQMRRELRRLGWRVVRLWEHQLQRHPHAAVKRILQLVNR
jgi:DNA mismatch endonuclease Vsr